MFTRNHARAEVNGRGNRSVLSVWRAGSGHSSWIQEAIESLKEFANVDRIGVWLEPEAESEDHASPVVFRGELWERAESNTPAEWNRLSADGPWPQQVLRRGNCVEYQGAEQETQPIVGVLLGMQHALWAPVNGDKFLRGLILTGSRQKQSELPKARMELLAAELGLLLEFEEQGRVSRRRQRDLAMWQRMQTELAGSQDASTMLKELMENCTREEKDGGVGAIFALVGERLNHQPVERPAVAGAEERLVICAQSGDGAWAHSVGQGPLENLWRETMAAGRVMGADADRLPLAKDISRIVAIPLQVHGEVWAALIAGVPRRKDPMEVLERLEMRALLAGQVLELQRRAGVEVRERCWQKALLDSSPESLVLVDAHGFVRGLSQGVKKFLRGHAMLDREFEEKNRFAELFRPRQWEEVHRWVMQSFKESTGEQTEALRAELRSGDVVLLDRLALSDRNFLAVGMQAAEPLPHARRVEEVEAELRQSLEWLQEGVLVFDQLGGIRCMNARSQQILGITPEEARGLRSIEELIGVVSRNAANPELFAANWRFLAAEGRTETQEELALEWPVQQVIERCSRPIVDEHGRNLGRVEVYQEVTARRMFQSRMQQTEKLASLGQRAIGIVHELSNPLTTILGNAQRLVLGNSLTGQSPEVLRILEESERASTILRQLLYLSRETQPLRRPIYLQELVTRTAELQRATLAGSKIALRLEHEKPLPPIDGDFAQLQQVLLNLLQNAQQAIEQSGKGTMIGVRTEQSDEGHVKLEVWDDGPGIPPAIQSRIYDPFFTTKPAGTGTGLGLSVALGFVRQHGGTVNLLSPAKGGAHFVMEFPVTGELPPRERLRRFQPQAQRMALQPSAGPAGPGVESRVMSPRRHPVARILVVEDEPTVAALIADVLREEGMLVDVLLDSESALQQAERETYDLLICDLKMPGIDGQTFYQTLHERANPLQHRVLFVTGDVLATRSHEFLAHHHLPYVAKPFRMEELSQAVHELLLAKPGAGNYRMQTSSRHVSGNG